MRKCLIIMLLTFLPACSTVVPKTKVIDMDNLTEDDRKELDDFLASLE